jgi:hypothetical protein
MHRDALHRSTHASRASNRTATIDVLHRFHVDAPMTADSFATSDVEEDSELARPSELLAMSDL